MATQQGKLFALAGAGALLLMASKNKKKKTVYSSNLDDDTAIEPEEDIDDGPEETETPKPSVLSKYMDSQGKAVLGGLYQIKPGDTPLEVCREALFGSRYPVVDPFARKAVIDLLVRIDCGPYNQALYGRPLSELMPGHAAAVDHWSIKGVSFNPIYSDNKNRIENGEAPSSAQGNSFALIWIPMINLDKFDLEGIVSTEGMYHVDDQDRMGGSTIDPPAEILNLGFDDLSIEGEVGCDLPEGDFKKKVISS